VAHGKGTDNQKTTVSRDNDHGQYTCICAQLELNQDCDTIKKSINVSLDVNVTTVVAILCEAIL